MSKSHFKQATCTVYCHTVRQVNGDVSDRFAHVFLNLNHYEVKQDSLDEMCFFSITYFIYIYVAAGEIPK